MMTITMQRKISVWSWNTRLLDRFTIFAWSTPAVGAQLKVSIQINFCLQCAASYLPGLKLQAFWYSSLCLALWISGSETNIIINIFISPIPHDTAGWMKHQIVSSMHCFTLWLQQHPVSLSLSLPLLHRNTPWSFEGLCYNSNTLYCVQLT